jgi:hypothetical protein
VTRLLKLLTCASALFVAAACSSEPASPDTHDGAAGEPGASGASSGGTAGSAPVSCPEGDNPKTDTKPVLVGLVSGQIVDEHGDPTSSGMVQVCGKNICINARVTDNGKLAENVGQELNAPACKFGDGLTWGKLALPIGAGDSELGTLMTARLPDFADAAAFTPGTAITSGGVTLTLAPNAHVDVDTLTYEEESQRGFRAVQLPKQAVTQLTQDFIAGWALSPVETRICPSPALSLENTADLAPGTPLELFMLGVDVLEEWAPYGGWQKVSEGKVSDDGATLEFPDGPPLLTAIGVREKR